MSVRIKICGIREPEHARVAAEAGADAIGLVFVESSPRHVTLDQARAVIDALPPFVEPVGLFVNATLSQVRTTSTALGLRMVQLHGGEEPAYARELAPLRILRGIAFDAATFTATARLWAEMCPNLAGLLVDTPPSPDAAAAGRTGGSGHCFDWQGLARACLAVGDEVPPLMLAGGLTADNVATAIAAVRPWAVDVSSGVESSRGVKDGKMIRRFCAAARNAQ